MGQFKIILWDIDGTLINFHAAEEVCIRDGLKKYGIEITDAQFKEYQRINRGYWEALERKEITKPEVYTNRFRDFFQFIGVDHIDPSIFNEAYQNGLAEVVVLEENALEVIRTLSKTHKQYAVTNGSVVAQKGKLSRSGLDKILLEVFISEEIGAEKPDIAFFNRVAEKIPDFKTQEAIIVGDSLTSDMLGGNNAGITCCWYNPKHLKNETEAKVDIEIEKLTDLYRVLGV